MHCPDPQAVLTEMLRVLQPGGWLLLSEPMNHQSYNESSWTLLANDVEAVVQCWRVWEAYRRGRISLGLGDNDMAIALPDLLEKTGIDDYKAYGNERIDITDIKALERNHLIDFLEKSQTATAIQAGGLQQADIEQAITGMQSMFDNLRTNHSKLVSAMTLLLFVARKSS